MRSNVEFGCNRMHFGALGNVPTLFPMFPDDFGDFWPGGLTFIDVLRVGGLLFMGAKATTSTHNAVSKKTAHESNVNSN